MKQRLCSALLLSCAALASRFFAQEYKLLLEQPDISYLHEQPVTIAKGRPTKIELEARSASPAEAQV